MLDELQKLETGLRSTFGGWSHYQLRLWQECRSNQSAGVEDRSRIAKSVLADPHRGEWVWALGGWHMLLAEIQAKLNDFDPHIRQDAAIALADLGPHARAAIPILLARLSSPEETLHDRECAAWTLPRIGVDGDLTLPIFVQVLDETVNQVEAGDLRFRASEAIEALSDSFRILVPLARRCLADRGWKSRMYGLALAERLGKRHHRLLEMLMPTVRLLLDYEAEEIRNFAGEIVDGIAKGV